MHSPKRHLLPLTAAVVAGLVIGGTLVASAADSAPEVVRACVTNAGTVRIVLPNDACAGGERLVTWNVQGAPGATGPAGPPGPAGTSAGLGGMQEFDTTGVWVAPAGVTRVLVDMWGAGGGGGCNGSGNRSEGGGGGGSGGYGHAIFTVVPGQSYTVTVGSGGAACVPGGAVAQRGGASRFEAPGMQLEVGGGGGGKNGANGTIAAPAPSTQNGGDFAFVTGSGTTIVRRVGHRGNPAFRADWGGGACSSNGVRAGQGGTGGLPHQGSVGVEDVVARGGSGSDGACASSSTQNSAAVRPGFAGGRGYALLSW